MEKTISTDVVKLDLKTILKNYKKPEFWNRDWLIIDTKWLSIIWHIKSIDCLHNKINSCVKVSKLNFKKGNKNIKYMSWYYEIDCNVIPINNNEYTQQHFENNIYGCIIRLLPCVESYLTSYYSEYEAARNQDDAFRKALREIAEKFLDENNVVNKAIRDAYIESYVDKQLEDRESYRDKVIKNFRYKLLTEVYVYTAAWFDNEQDFNKYKKFSKDRKSTYKEIRDEIKLIQTDEWRDSMKNKLEGI